MANILHTCRIVAKQVRLPPELQLALTNPLLWRELRTTPLDPPQWELKLSLPLNLRGHCLCAPSAGNAGVKLERIKFKPLEFTLEHMADFKKTKQNLHPQSSEDLVNNVCELYNLTEVSPEPQSQGAEPAWLRISVTVSFCTLLPLCCSCVSQDLEYRHLR